MTDDKDPGPAVQRVILGALIRDARELAGLSPTVATKALKWYSGKLSKVEAGDVRLQDKDLATAIRVFKIPDDQAESLYRLAAEARRTLPPSRVPEWAAKYVALERSASSVAMYYGDFFPGTVQTRDYAQAFLAASITVSAAEVDRMADQRASRSAQVKELPDRHVRLVVGEEALYREIGGRDVLREQLELIYELASLPHVTIQVIPFSAGAHASHGVSFTILNFTEHRLGIVYNEGLTGSDYLSREHTRIYSLAFNSLCSAAATPETTMELVARRIADLGA